MARALVRLVTLAGIVWYALTGRLQNTPMIILPFNPGGVNGTTTCGGRSEDNPHYPMDGMDQVIPPCQLRSAVVQMGTMSSDFISASGPAPVAGVGPAHGVLDAMEPCSRLGYHLRKLYHHPT